MTKLNVEHNFSSFKYCFLDLGQVFNYWKEQNYWQQKKYH